MYRVVRVPLAASLPLLAPFVAGPVRYYTHAPFALCFVLALSSLVAAAWMIRGATSVRVDARFALAVVAVGLVLAGWMVRDLYRPAIDGMAGSDTAAAVSAMHARAGVRFGAQEHDVAHGQVALYAWMATARLFGVQTFASLRFAFYLCVVVLGLAMAGAASLAAAALPTRRIRLIFVALYLPSAILTLRWAIVPLLHAYQAGGEFPQLLSLMLLAILSLSLALVDSPSRRALLGLAGVVALRFTYAINVGGLAIALAMLSFAEALAAPAAQRRRWLVVSGGWLVVGAIAMRQLFLARALVRPAPPIDQFWTQMVLLSAALALTAIPEWIARSGAVASPPMRRLIAFARNFAMANWLAIYAYLVAHLARPRQVPLAFLYETHLFVPVVIALIVLLPCLVCLTTVFIANARRAKSFAFGVAVTLAFAALLSWSLRAAWPAALGQARERASARPPFTHLVALDDRDADRFIARVLHDHHAPIGGLVAAGTTATFLAAAWDAPAELPTPLVAGRCYFWSSTVAGSEAVEALRARATLVCRQYRPRWAPASPREICAVCP